MSKALDFYLDLCSSGAIEKDQNRLRMAQQSVLFDKTLEFLIDESTVKGAERDKS